MTATHSYDAIASGFAAEPLWGLSLTLPQETWIRRGSPEDPDRDGRPLLWLGANQIGKSYALAAKLLHYLRRTGPYANRPPGPRRVTVVSISKDQIIPLMEKIWGFLPKRDGVPIEAPDVEFEEEFGFRGKPPRVVFKTGLAAGCTITFATYFQGSQRVAGSTRDVLVLDEPPPESLWGEVVLRVLRRHGEIWICMTITPDAPPQEWLEDYARKGEVRLLQTPLRVDTVRPTDGSPPFLSERDIADARRKTPAAEQPLRFDAAWRGATVDRWLSAWDGTQIYDGVLPPNCIGIVSIDHGIRPGRQAAVLLGHQRSTQRTWLLDETPVSEIATSTQQDAAAIAAMLARNGMSWENVEIWRGDRACDSHWLNVRKDNARLRRYLAAHYKVSPDRFPRIEPPYKAAGTMLAGMGSLNARLADGKIRVRSKCKRFIASAQGWAGDKRDPLKDYLDAFRYGDEAALLLDSNRAVVVRARTR